MTDYFCHTVNNVAHAPAYPQLEHITTASVALKDCSGTPEAPLSARRRTVNGARHRIPGSAHLHGPVMYPGPLILPMTSVKLADSCAALVDEAKALYSEYLNTAAIADKLLDFVAQRLEAQPEESDVVHDLLAYLAECMIEMNKEKNAEIKSFLTFIEGETGAVIDDMTNKTAIREYYNHEFQKLIDILVKNKKKLRDGYDPKSPTNYRHLQEWYNDSVGKLQPLM
ncbi:MAG: hypothetical protein E4G94_06900, partial [ANME-2 cluster archaeon]